MRVIKAILHKLYLSICGGWGDNGVVEASAEYWRKNR